MYTVDYWFEKPQIFRVDFKGDRFCHILFKPFVEKRIKKDLCPVCSKPKLEWKEDKKWTCCSIECDKKFGEKCVIFIVPGD